MRVDGYVRVSRVGYRGGERFISPSVQRDQILGWATARQARLLEVWEELDESGARPDRPLLELAVQRIERGVSDGLVVARVDRFGRSLVDALLMIQRIEKAGGLFYSVQDGLDISTDTGRLVLRIMLSMAEWELDRIRAQWQEAKARAVYRGAFTGAWTPPGYRKTRAGRLRLDPNVAPIIAEAFRLRATGAPMLEVCRLLEAHHVRTGKGNRCWSVTSATRALASPVYLGHVRYGAYINDHAHPALVDGATWEAAQRPRMIKAPPRFPKAFLSGLVRCAACGMTMSPSVRYDCETEFVMYACRKYYAAGSCPEPAYISSAVLHPCVESIMFGLLARRRRPPRGDVQRAEDRVATTQQALARYRDSDRVLGTLGESTFAAGLAARVERLHAARLELVDARDRLAAHSLPPVTEVRSCWPTMTTFERRELLGQVIDVVFAKRGKQLPLRERVMVCPAGTAPANLARAGMRSAPLRSYKPRRSWKLPP
jgi:DNA invertase Pin-like site-specific DNA recombinase